MMVFIIATVAVVSFVLNVHHRNSYDEINCIPRLLNNKQQL